MDGDYLIIIILLVVLAVYVLLNYYVLNRIIKGTKILVPNIKIILVKVIGIILSFSTLLSFVLSSNNIGVLGAIGNYWFGFLVVAIAIFLLSDLIMLIWRIAKKIPKVLNKKVFLINIVVIFIVFIYGIVHGNNIYLESYDINISKKSNIDKLNVVMFSDMHLGYINGKTKLEKVVNKINEQNPDIVIIAGDLYDGNYEAIQNKAEVERLLGSIKSKYGTYMAWGNHDAGTNFQKMKKSIGNTNIKLLEDKVEVIKDTVAIAGRKDSRPIGDQGSGRTTIHDELDKLEKDLPVIVIDHRPSNIHEYKNNVDLILSGHTHKGQIFPGNLVTNLMYTVDYGHYEDSTGVQTIVSSGAGVWGPPMRIGTNSEIVKININFN